ncbi:MAG: metal ABC transporter solute-binding protein, Zn/Mn family [Chitinophagales bacterium]
MKKYSLIILVALLFSCKNENTKTAQSKIKIVSTTTMITDMVKNIGGDKIELQGLMGAGVDPHLYKASEGDVNKLFEADMILYNGLHLEGKLEDVFEKMKLQNKKVVAVSDAIDKKKLIASELFDSNFDPHIWFDLHFWKQCTEFIAAELATFDKANAAFYKKNATDYIAALNTLEQEIDSSVLSLPTENRVLVTAHDAFNYFGKAYYFEVVGLQGLSTATEAGVKDVQELSTFIVERKIKAVFVESSVPKRTIEALQEAVKAKGHNVNIGGTLYSDALGNKGSVEGTYLGMYRHNISTIVNALK